jgi:mono/diheme cytochrome c family protein
MPWILIAIALLAAAVSSIYLQSQPPKARTTAPTLASAAGPPPDGQLVYRSRCAACHGTDGQGLRGAFPPIAGAEIANRDEIYHIKIVLEGMSGPLVVKGIAYDGTMPPFNLVLSAAEIAAVITYERTAFGNSGGAVSVDDVVKMGGRP